jgi:hypothetical protein
MGIVTGYNQCIGGFSMFGEFPVEKPRELEYHRSQHRDRESQVLA